MTAGAGRAVAYTAFNMTATINPGSSASSVVLGYDSGHARIQQVTSIGTTLYLNDGGVMSERLAPAGGGQSIWKTYLQADGQIVAERKTAGASGGPAMSYFVLDHLGSILAITDDQSTTVTRQYFDAWGKERNADGTPDPTCSLPVQSQALANTRLTRGFANQEEMPGVCLVNMNARLYDPQIGRFLTADPSDGSGLNRYWYVGDNPLSLTDPTGLCFLGCFWKSPAGKAVIDIVLVIVLHEYALPLIEAQLTVTVADVANIAASAGIAGYVTTGRLDSALIQSAEAVAMYGVGQYVDGLEDPAHPVVTNFQGGIIRIGLHGLVGGLASAAGHGGFVSGFLAAGFGAAADTIDTGEMPIDVITHAVAGGVGSALGGGKFSDGAVTGAFGYLFNNCMQDPVCLGHHNARAVYSPGAGTVSMADWQVPNNHAELSGFEVRVDADDGSQWRFAHMDPNTTVPVGTRLDRGDYIGDYADPTNGHSTGPHVHVGHIVNGQHVDPGDDPPVVNGTTPPGGQWGDISRNHPVPHNGRDWRAPH